MSEPLPVKTAHWRIVAPNHSNVLPDGFLTVAPGLPSDAVPAEVGLLLPAGNGGASLTDMVAADSAIGVSMGVGLFMANPFLDVDREAARLRSAGVTWVANLPSTHQQDAEFRQQLEDVGLDWAREIACLPRFGTLGLKRLAVLSDEAAAADVLIAEPDAVVILPHVADFAAGFPSMLRRGGSAQAVGQTLRAEGWQGPVLVLGNEAEDASPTLWPHGVDALLLRPVL